MKIKIKLLCFFTAVGVFVLSFGFASKAEAAILYLLPETKTPRIGQEFFVDVKINSQEGFINASQVKVSFPNGVLEMVGAEKIGSIFNFWLEDPVISNEEGNMRFIGGASKGFSGESLQAIRMKFKAKTVGSANILISDAMVTANDGLGTNVLSIVNGTDVRVEDTQKTAVPSVTSVPSTPVSAPSTPVVVSSGQEAAKQPEVVVRQAVLAKGLPEKPKLSVPLYSDETRWYNRLGEVIALWEVPLDVTKIAVEIDKSPRTVPTKTEPVLVNGKNFGVLKEGIWYIHAQFKNNVGWGGVTHYKISVDTGAPLSFNIEISSLASDNPTPKIKYETQDGLSGIAKTLISVDNGDPIFSTELSAVLPVQKPGKHRLSVRVFDFAGNSVEDALDFEIIPLPKPEVRFVTNKITQGESFFISGSALPNSFVDLKITDEKKRVIVENTANSDSLGNWENTVENLSIKDNYVLSLTTRDQRGAVSYPTDDQIIIVKAKTILSLGGIDLSLNEIFIAVILLIVSGVGFVAWKYSIIQSNRYAYKVIAERDIKKFSDMIEKEIEVVESENKKSKEIGQSAKATIEFRMNEIKNILSRMRKYLGSEIKK